MSEENIAPRHDDAAASSNEALSALRREIDQLDDAMFALVERRVAAAMGVAEVKRNDTDGRLRMRPAREAAVVDRLAGKAVLSPPALVRQVWQEIMACCLNLQVPNQLVLHAADEPALLTDAMRRRFGCAARLVVAGSSDEALQAAREREAVAIVELAQSSSWWTALRDEAVLAIFDCLRDENGRVIGLAIGRIAAEDLKACPRIRIQADTDAPDGEILASADGLRLVLAHRDEGDEA